MKRLSKLIRYWVIRLLINMKNDEEMDIWINPEKIVAITSVDGEFEIEMDTGSVYITDKLPIELINEVGD